MSSQAEALAWEEVTVALRSLMAVRMAIGIKMAVIMTAGSILLRVDFFIFMVANIFVMKPYIQYTSGACWYAME
jgi:hypothetical protein